MIGSPRAGADVCYLCVLRQVLQQHQRFEYVTRRKLFGRTGRDEMQAVVPASE